MGIPKLKWDSDAGRLVGPDVTGRFLELHYQGGRGRPAEVLRFRKSSARKFWASVRRGAGCWEWTGGRHSEGYGRFKTAGHRFLAHRLAFTMLRGPVPPDKDLDHICRNHACVNPAHLEPVTNLENCRRGEQAASIRGARNVHAKLTDAEARQVADLAMARTMTQRKIAELYGVSQSVVTHIKTGRAWRFRNG